MSAPFGSRPRRASLAPAFLGGAVVGALFARPVSAMVAGFLVVLAGVGLVDLAGALLAGGAPWVVHWVIGAFFLGPAGFVVAAVASAVRQRAPAVSAMLARATLGGAVGLLVPAAVAGSSPAVGVAAVPVGAAGGLLAMALLRVRTRDGHRRGR